MNFSISKSVFANVLGTVSHAVLSNSPQPALRGIYLEAENNELTIIGSDADLSIQKKMKQDDQNGLSILEEGSVLIEAKYLLEMVRKIDGQTITLEVIDGNLIRFAGETAEYKINGMNPDNYPFIDFTVQSSSIQMDAAMLTQIIDQTTFAASVKETKQVLMGVNFNFANQVLICTATDSYRLAKKTIPLTQDGNFNITIPAKALNEVKGTLLVNQEGTITIAQNDKKVQFICDDTIFQARLLDSAYPDTDRLIPKEFKYTLHVNRMDFIQAVERSNFIRNENMSVNRLQCSTGEVIISSKSQEIGDFKQPLTTGTFTGDPLDISFNGAYVAQAARVIGSENIDIKFTAPMRPFILCTDEDPTILQLVLPVRTYN